MGLSVCSLSVPLLLIGVQCVQRAFTPSAFWAPNFSRRQIPRSVHKTRLDAESRRQLAVSSLLGPLSAVSIWRASTASADAAEKEGTRMSRQKEPKNLGPRRDGSLAPCPETPNCYCSSMPEKDVHYYPPWRFTVSLDDAIKDVHEAVNAYPQAGQQGVDEGGWTIITDTPQYIYVQYVSGENGFIDDLELLVIPAGEDLVGGEVRVRSSSRVGVWDLGVNSKRLNWYANRLGKLKGWTASTVDPQSPDEFMQKMKREQREIGDQEQVRKRQEAASNQAKTARRLEQASVAQQPNPNVPLEAPSGPIGPSGQMASSSTPLPASGELSDEEEDARLDELFRQKGAELTMPRPLAIGIRNGKFIVDRFAPIPGEEDPGDYFLPASERRTQEEWDGKAAGEMSREFQPRALTMEDIKGQAQANKFLRLNPESMKSLKKAASGKTDVILDEATKRAKSQNALKILRGER